MPGSELIGELEKQAVLDVFNEGGVLFAHGSDKIRNRYFVREFEKELTEILGCAYVQCVSSGSAALYCALKALEIGPGDEVITQSHNFIATVEAIVLTGATPVICDVDASLNMCPVSLKAKLTDRTKAIIPVHMLGVPCEMDEIWKVSAQSNLPVIEDACEAVGAYFNGKHVGTLSQMGVHSYDFGKNITTGEGGSVFTSSDELYLKLRAIHDHGHSYQKPLQRGIDPISTQGFNFRMTEISGSIGIVQLSRLPSIIAENRIRYNLLHEGLSAIDQFQLRTVPSNAVPSYDTFVFQVEDNDLRQSIVSMLNSRIGCKNLPGAITWHCSYYWDHLVNPDNNEFARKTLERLQRNIAIPISLRVDTIEYQNILSEIIALVK